MATKTKTVDHTTTVGILSFPRVFKSTAGKKDDGTPSYDIQIIIDKKDREGLKAIVKAIREVGEDKWGDKWRGVKSPLRDGDKEADDLTDDGSTKGEKYPERLGCYFMNARSGKPVAVVHRDLTPMDEPSDLYGGCKGRISVNFYAYSSNGNHGIAAGLNGVQKISDGEPLAAGAPAVESMFEILGDEDEDDLGLDDEIEEEEEAPAPKRTAKKAAAKRKPAPVVEEDEDELEDLEDEDDEEEEEEEEAPAPKRRAPAKKAPAKKAAVKRKPVVEEDEDDLLDDLDDEDA